MTSSQPPQQPGGHGEQPPGGPPPYGQQPSPPQQPPPPQPRPQAPPPPAPPGGTPSHSAPGGPYGYPVDAGPGAPPPGSPPPHYTPPPPAYGPPPGSQPPPGYGPPPPGYYGQPPYGAPPYGPPATGGSAVSFDLKKLRMADYVIAGGAILYLIFAILPWFDYSYYYFGVKNATFFNDTLSGFGSGLVTSAFVLFLLAALWALLPAVYNLHVSFPRAWITAGASALGLVLTLIAWIQSLGGGFFIFALLGFVVAVGITLFALLTLLPELRKRPALPGALAGAAQWANQQAPDPFAGRGQGGQPGQPGPGHAGPGHAGMAQPGQPGQPGYGGQPGQPPTQPYGGAPYGQPGPGSGPAAPPPPPYGQPGGPTPPPAPPTAPVAAVPPPSSPAPPTAPLPTPPVSGHGSEPAPGSSGDDSAAQGGDSPHTDGSA